MKDLKIKRHVDEINGEIFYTVHKDPKRNWIHASIIWNERWKHWYFSAWDSHRWSAQHMIQISNFMNTLEPVKTSTE